MKKVVIIGAGISGLSLAWHLQKRCGPAIDLHIIDKAPRAGGWMYTKNIDGFLFEMGPRTFKASRCQALLELIYDMGLEESLIFSSKDSVKRYIWLNGKLQLLPSNPLSLFTSPLTRGSLLSLAKEWFVPPGTGEDESIYDFVTRRLNQKVANTLFDPFTLGIFAGDIRKLSIRSCFPGLFDWERNKGSITGGIFSLLKEKMQNKQKINPYHQLSHVGLFSLKEGNYRLIEEMTSKLNADIQYSTEVISIKPKGQGVEVVTTSRSIFADSVFLATPVKDTARLLSFLTSSNLSFFNELKTVTLGAVYLGYKKNLLQDKAFGYLIPSSEKEKVLGVVWDSIIFPKRNTFPEETKLTVVIGGAHNPESTKFTESDCLRLAKDAVYRHMGITAVPDAVGYTLAKDSIPQFEVGHFRKLEAFEKGLHELCPQIKLVGNYLDSVSVNGCIERAQKIAEKWSKEQGVNPPSAPPPPFFVSPQPIHSK